MLLILKQPRNQDDLKKQTVGTVITMTQQEELRPLQARRHGERQLGSCFMRWMLAQQVSRLVSAGAQ